MGYKMHDTFQNRFGQKKREENKMAPSSVWLGKLCIE
jgi:hypothetical protein